MPDVSSNNPSPPSSPSSSQPSSPRNGSSVDVSNVDSSNVNVLSVDVSSVDVSSSNVSSVDVSSVDISSVNVSSVDLSLNPITIDISGKQFVIPSPILDEVKVIDLATVTNQQGMDVCGVFITYTTMATDELDPSADVVITEKLVSYVDDEFVVCDPSKNQLLNEIKLYASEIQCDDFHGKGTIDDYKELFIAASKITTDIKQVQLDVDIQGFKDFADAADEMSKLFTSFILKLENINIIDDSLFLAEILNSLKRIANLSKTFEQFKKTILLTTKIHIPKSTKETCEVLDSVLGEVNCAMNYISHFVAPSGVAPVDSELDPEDKKTIETAVATINNWSVLSDQGVSIAMKDNDDIKCITTVSSQVKVKAQLLNNATNALKAKMNSYKFNV